MRWVLVVVLGGVVLWLVLRYVVGIEAEIIKYRAFTDGSWARWDRRRKEWVSVAAEDVPPSTRAQAAAAERRRGGGDPNGEAPWDRL